MSDTPRFNSYWNSYRSGAISVEEFKEAVQNLERENAALRAENNRLREAESEITKLRNLYPKLWPTPGKDKEVWPL